MYHQVIYQEADEDFIDTGLYDFFSFFLICTKLGDFHNIHIKSAFHLELNH